jgi:S-adenosylmethionine hydrolase
LIQSDTGLVVYAVPTYKVGKFDIEVKIPGIQPYHILGNIKPFPVEALYVKLDKYQAAPNEVVKGKIFGVDKFGNLKTYLKNLKITSSQGIKVSLN